ncbi:hypothetical protein CIB95_08930 [Lottiidibacillus patelloidae]|uniref:Lipocalin-like domain-containing protein n=1 Tax=Lottiidibacillus patelloidae TaxID=2670334 RepID=A0A263BT48_9BACI|nr:hypothetical protein [Lottiidibacillus patelloidae]OZM56884.1 hypothetical protein CIB95_08930 [Lottiidibacillus patelloidae]
MKKNIVFNTFLPILLVTFLISCSSNDSTLTVGNNNTSTTSNKIDLSTLEGEWYTVNLQIQEMKTEEKNKIYVKVMKARAFALMWTIESEVNIKESGEILLSGGSPYIENVVHGDYPYTYQIHNEKYLHMSGNDETIIFELERNKDFIILKNDIIQYKLVPLSKKEQYKEEAKKNKQLLKQSNNNFYNSQ